MKRRTKLAAQMPGLIAAIHAEVERCLAARAVFKESHFLAGKNRRASKRVRSAFREVHGKSPKQLYLAKLSVLPSKQRAIPCLQDVTMLREDIAAAVIARRPLHIANFLSERGVKTAGPIWGSFRQCFGCTPSDHYFACLVERVRELQVASPTKPLTWLVLQALPAGSTDKRVKKILALLEAEQSKAA